MRKTKYRLVIDLLNHNLMYALLDTCNDFIKNFKYCHDAPRTMIGMIYFALFSKDKLARAAYPSRQ